jgi:hypothetical protein
MATGLCPRNLDGITELMALLSHCQHALVMAEAGKEVNLPLSPPVAFDPQAGQYLLGAYEIIARLATGYDEMNSAVALMILSHAGRLSGFRISEETARALADGLNKVLAQMPRPATKQ